MTTLFLLLLITWVSDWELWRWLLVPATIWPRSETKSFVSFPLFLLVAVLVIPTFSLFQSEKFGGIFHQHLMVEIYPLLNELPQCHYNDQRSNRVVSKIYLHYFHPKYAKCFVMSEWNSHSHSHSNIHPSKLYSLQNW